MDNYKWRASLIAQLIKNQPAMYKGGKGCPGLVTGIRDALTTRASLVAQDSKELTCNVGDLGLIPALGRSPGGRHGNPLQYSCLENPMDRGAWWAAVRGVTKSQTRLSD